MANDTACSRLAYGNAAVFELIRPEEVSEEKPWFLYEEHAPIEPLRAAYQLIIRR